MAGLLGAFTLQRPDIRFDLVDGTEQELLNRLDERGVDYALSIRRVADDASVALFEEGYQLALPRHHRLAGCGKDRWRRPGGGGHDRAHALRGLVRDQPSFHRPAMCARRWFTARPRTSAPWPWWGRASASPSCPTAMPPPMWRGPP
ncbi:MAG: LysR substrate-binding domain-containing protein [Asticcacaulis sp.]